VIGLTLRTGQRVTNLPVRTWMAYVSSEASRLIAGINQNMLRHVRAGQKAEVVFKLYPSRTFTATVETIAPLTPQGQLQPSGIVPTAPTPNLMPATYGVILKLDDKASAVQRLPGGAMGIAAIYTDNVKATHIIRKVMMRMQSWINYIIPY
jgi:multidrug resistance efflux pump